jgi:hypothetical protein
MRLVPGQQLLFCPLGGGTSDSIYTGQVSCLKTNLSLLASAFSNIFICCVLEHI